MGRCAVHSGQLAARGRLRFAFRACLLLAGARASHAAAANDDEHGGVTSAQPDGLFFAVPSVGMLRWILEGASAADRPDKREQGCPFRAGTPLRERRLTGRLTENHSNKNNQDETFAATIQSNTSSPVKTQPREQQVSSAFGLSLLHLPLVFCCAANNARPLIPISEICLVCIVNDCIKQR